MTDKSHNEPAKNALVLSGGGARAAYQVGCLRYIAKAIPEYRPQILTGVSAGAINAVHLAAYRGSWQEAVSALSNLWLSLDTNRVYVTHIGSILRRVVKWGLRLTSGGRLGLSELRGMVDNRPLHEFLAAALPNQDGRILGIEENLAEGLLESLAIVTTNYGSGRSVAWVEGSDDMLWERGQLRANDADITLDHIMASSALPMFFPAVKLDATAITVDGDGSDPAWSATSEIEVPLSYGKVDRAWVSALYTEDDVFIRVRWADKTDLSGLTVERIGSSG